MELRCSVVSHLLAFSHSSISSSSPCATTTPPTLLPTGFVSGYLVVSALLFYVLAIHIFFSPCKLLCDRIRSEFVLKSSPVSGISLANPVIEVAPSPIAGQSTAAASKDAFSCQRVRVSGVSRLQLGSYANSFTVTLVPSAVIPDRLRANVQVCFHRNASRGLCQCHEYDWKNIRKRLWTSSMSPYEERYVDVKFIGGVPGSVTVTVKEDPQQWRLVFLALGFFMLLLAPVMSNWVLFYYSSSMVIGLMLVIIFLLFQGMKFLPTCRKSAFYLFIYGSSLIGAGSFLLHHYSMMINSIFVNFGLNDEILNPVTIFTLVLIVIAGAGLGFWIVRRFIISADGHVDVGIAQFVKWAMRILGSTSIPLSSDDTPLAFGALVSCWTISIVLHYVKWISERRDENHRWGGFWPWRNKQSVTSHQGAEFLSRKSKRLGNKGTQWTRTQSPPNFNGSPVQGLVSPSAAKFTRSDIRDHYSTFHKTPNRRRFSRREWEEFTEESTKQAMSELASTPQFTEWLIENANRIKLQSDDSSYESEAGSSGEHCCGQWQQN